MESDERFKHLATDPRFRTLRKPQRKIKIDDRFQSMFTDKKFTLKYSKDKRGRKQNKTTGDDLKKYYSLDDEIETGGSISKIDRSSEQLQEEKAGSDADSTHDEDGEKSEDDAEFRGAKDCDSQEEDDESQEEDSESQDESEVSSSSDESDTDEEELERDMVNIKYDWQSLDHDAETAETTTRRLAIQNLDWDRLDIKDIYVLINSIRAPISVKIYVSDFGKERLKQEELEGPKELADMPKVDEEEEEYQSLKNKMRVLKDPGAKTYKTNEYEDADEAVDLKNEEIRERIRKYQLSRLKYYYAVAEFDSSESAEAVYKELDGMEYLGSSLELDLRFIPDDIEFDPDNLKAECDKLPDLANYKAPNFINSALQQVTVKFTWDETDIKRQERLNRAYTKEELERDDLEAYLASDTDTEEEVDDEEAEFNDGVSVVTANSEARVNKYRMLLQSLEEEAERKKKVDVDVEWGNFSEDEKKIDGGKIGSESKEISSSSSSDFDGEDDEEEEEEEEGELSPERSLKLSAMSRREQRQMKKEMVKERRRLDKKKAKSNKKKKQEQESSEDEELDLLVMDENRKRDEFNFDPEDGRFKAVYESALYNIDPSHPNFKRTQAFDLIAEKKREKRQKTSS